MISEIETTIKSTRRSTTFSRKNEGTNHLFRRTIGNVNVNHNKESKVLIGTSKKNKQLNGSKES